MERAWLVRKVLPEERVGNSVAGKGDMLRLEKA